MNPDIKRAKKHLDDMIAYKKVSEVESAWQDFLFRLERIWEISRKRHEKQRWFSKVYGPYASLRKKDPLLKYLKQARNAETHTIVSTLDAPISITVRDKNGRPFNVDKIKSTMDKTDLTIDIDSSDKEYEFEADAYRETPVVTRFKSRKDWYNPPTTHLGKVIDTKCPITIGNLGLDFCQKFLDEVNEHTKKT
ncbi:MAG: hypothetical protein KZQ91_07650 [Candidatus Thiodiazotropha sp. (ex Lucinoma borealis)]|nr:hypothetical protein [Candidatus Thiodiazotropha sp. (ex Lucinoma borealis)]